MEHTDFFRNLASAPWAKVRTAKKLGGIFLSVLHLESVTMEYKPPNSTLRLFLDTHLESSNKKATKTKTPSQQKQTATAPKDGVFNGTTVDAYHLTVAGLRNCTSLARSKLDSSFARVPCQTCSCYMSHMTYIVWRDASSRKRWCFLSKSHVHLGVIQRCSFHWVVQF